MERKRGAYYRLSRNRSVSLNLNPASAASQTASLLLGTCSRELKGGFLFVVAFFFFEPYDKIMQIIRKKETELKMFETHNSLNAKRYNSLHQHNHSSSYIQTSVLHLY